MGELGDEAPRLHGYVGAYAAAKGVDLLVLVGDALADEMAEAARTMGLSEDAIERFGTVEDAVRVIGPVLAEGDAYNRTDIITLGKLPLFNADGTPKE